MKKSFLVIVVISLIFTASSALAYVMSSPHYRLQSDSLNIGGVREASPSYRMEDTIGEVGTGDIGSALNNLKAGYQQTAAGIPGALCNNNGVCEPQWGETAELCADCRSTAYIPPSAPIVVEESTPGHPEIAKSLIVNNDAVYTTSPDVALSLSAENASQMAINNSPDFTNISWEPYQTSKSWTLPQGDGEKTVYVKFRSPDGGVSQVVFDSIILDTAPPTNVFNFEAVPGDNQITLTWQNPPDSDFKAVKIVRAEGFYPSSPWEGTAIYDDKGTSFVDTGLKSGTRYYYTAFAYDFVENYASGAITSAVTQGLPQPEVPPPPELIPPVLPPPPEIEKIILEYFKFLQEGQMIPLTEGFKITIEAGEPLTISIPYESVPEVLKTIMVTLEKDGKTFSFLLRINAEKTDYSTTFLPSEEPGIYPFTITILDYKNQTLKKITGQLEVGEIEAGPLAAPWYKGWQNLAYALLALSILVIAGYFIINFKNK